MGFHVSRNTPDVCPRWRLALHVQWSLLGWVYAGTLRVGAFEHGGCLALSHLHGGTLVLTALSRHPMCPKP